MIPATTAVRPKSDASARISTGADNTNRTSWLLCRAGGLVCALPIEHVVEIMRPLAVERIAGAPDYVRGLSIIRGGPVPVVDLGVIVGNRAIQPTRLITVRTATRPIALAVDAVLGINVVTDEATGQLPPLLRDAATDVIAAIGALDNELIVFLQGARLIPDDVLARLEADEHTS
jgi:purine-binding chemotaxis protein CheW